MSGEVGLAALCLILFGAWVLSVAYDDWRRDR